MTMTSLKKNILITGGSGFIGTHLTRRLLDEGHAVTNLDLIPGKLSHSNLKNVIGDTRNRNDVLPLLQGIDAVFHFAAVASVQRCQEEPSIGYSTNLLATALLTECIREAQKKCSQPQPRVIFSSSAAVYGRLGEKYEKLSEEIPLEQPLSHYAIHKLASEQLLRMEHETRKLPVVNFRFFNVYGDGQDPTSSYSGVITHFKSKLKAGIPLALFGGGTQTRDFIHVSDIVEACLKALALDSEQCHGKPVNLGSGQVITVKELALLMDSKAKLESLPPREGDITRSCADISTAGQYLKWNPTKKLSQGLQEFLSG